MTLLAAASGWIALAGALLAAVLCGLEWRRHRHRRRVQRALRLLATLAAAAALLLLALRPGRWVSADPRAAVLYTAGSERLGSRLGEPQRKPPGEATLRFALATDSGERAGPPDALTLPDTGYLTRHYPAVDRLTVLGHGLDRWQLDALAAQIKAAPPPAASPGLERVTWTRHLWLGEPFEAQGRWTPARPLTETTAGLELHGPGGAEASLAWPSAAASDAATAAPTLPPQPFQFSSQPRTAGRFLYRLTGAGDQLPAAASDGEPAATTAATSAASTVGAGPLLDVVVERPAPLRLLWLEAAPRFETNHFKHWFTEQTGGALALRTQISRDRYRFETIPSRGSLSQVAAPARLSREALSGFDLAVLDYGSLIALSGGELDAVRAAVAADGLGILLLPYGEQAPPAERLHHLALDFPVRPAGPLAELDVRLELGLADNDRARTTEPAPTLTIPALEIATGEASTTDGVSSSVTEPLLSDTAGRVLAARRPLGAGAVGIDLALDSFRFILAGHPERHAALWSRLVSALARPGSPHRWQLPPEPALLDHAFTLTLRTDAEAPSATVTGPDGEPLPLALAQDPGEPSRWSARFWPRAEGWHRLSADNRPHATDRSTGTHTGASDAQSPETPLAESWFYAQPARPWRSWLEARRRQATAERVERDATATRAPDAAQDRLVRQRRELPRGGFYALLLLSLAALWIDERLHTRPG